MGESKGIFGGGLGWKMVDILVQSMIEMKQMPFCSVPPMKGWAYPFEGRLLGRYKGGFGAGLGWKIVGFMLQSILEMKTAILWGAPPGRLPASF